MSLLIQVGLFSSYNWLYFFFARDQPALHHLKIVMLWRVSDSPLDFKRVCCVFFFLLLLLGFLLRSPPALRVFIAVTPWRRQNIRDTFYPQPSWRRTLTALQVEVAMCSLGCLASHGLEGSCPLGQPLGLGCSSASGAVLALVRHPCHPWALVTSVWLREWKPSLANAHLGAKRSNRDAVTLCCGLSRYH